MFDYEMKTTFWQDFTIADIFGMQAIKDTYERAFAEWQTDYEYITELFMVLNWKLWEHYNKGEERVARLYDVLWKTLRSWIYDNFNEEELRYFYRVTD